MNIVHAIRIVLIALLLGLIAAIVYGVVRHPLIALALLATLQALGMWWAWCECTHEEIGGFQRVWMTVAWPLTAVIGAAGRVQ